MKRSVIILLLLSGMAISCSVSPQPIRYGEDMCDYCWMTIVDRSHAAEIVTKKGKAFKFDSIECLLHFQRKGEITPADIALCLVSDLYSDGAFTTAESATYLKCPQIPSPMGAYLSAFEDRGRAADVHREMGGTLYSWESLQDSFAAILDLETPDRGNPNDLPELD